MRRLGVAAAFSALAFAGCGSSATPEASLTDDFLNGISQLRDTHDYKRLRSQIVRTLASLRRDPAPTAATRRAKQLAVRGFEWTRRGIESRIDFVENDRGNIQAATRDAIRADRALKKGANLLRAAGEILGFRLGRLNGF
jgi:hypothetical protein